MNKNKKTAFLYATELLSMREYSVNKLKEKLLRKEYTEEEIENAVKKLENLRLINETETVKSQFRFLYERSKNSVKEIKYKLLRRGFSRETIDEAAEETIQSSTEENGTERELSAALKALRIKYGKNKDPLKMRGYLFRHGFSTDICYDAVRKFLEEN